MKLLRKIKNYRYFKLLSNIYLIIFIIFLFWILFFDSNSILVNLKLQKEINQLIERKIELKVCKREVIHEERKWRNLYNWIHRRIMGKIISISNQKGGVGKTTTSVSLAASLGVLEKKVLLIDADPQGNASSGIGISSNEINLSTYDVLLKKCEPKDAIIKTNSPNLDLIPANIDLVAIEIELIDMNERELIFSKVFKNISNNYDFLIIDCPPSLGLITLNALTASNSVIIPIQCEYYALEGLGKLLNTIKGVQSVHNQDLEIEGVLLTMYDSRLRLSNQVKDDVKKHFGGMVFNTIIPRNVSLGEAPSYGESIIVYNATSKGSKSYIKFAQEIINLNQIG